MTLIDRYVLREWLKILGLVLGATVGLMLMQTLYDDFRNLLDKDVGFGETMLYLGVKIPSFLAIVLPIALLVSLLYALSLLHRSNEIVAMRAAGLGIFRITRIIWLFGIFFCGLMWFLNANVVPWSVETSRDMLDNFSFRKQAGEKGASAALAGITKLVTFHNQRQGRMWFFNRYSESLGRAYGVTVSELDGRRREKTRILAREGRLDPERHYWIFLSGREEWLDPETGDVTHSVPFAEKAVPHFNEDPDLMLAFDLKPVDLSFFQLQRIIDYFTVEENPKVTLYAVRYYGLLADTISPLIVIALAIPFALTGVRVNPAVGVSKAIGLFVVYFLLLKTANTLGSRGVVDPLLAAWLPSIVMLGVGSIFLARMR